MTEVSGIAATVSRPRKFFFVRQHRAFSGQRLASLLPAGLLLIVGIIGPLVTPYDPMRIAGPSSLPPGKLHFLGTDSLGLDVFSQLLAATHRNLIIALSVVGLSTAASVTLGLMIGMNEAKRGLLGILARGFGRLLDLLQAMPAIVTGLILASFFGASTITMIVAISIILTPLQARLVRVEVLRVRSEAFVDAARMAGTGELVLTLRHVMPNAARPALTNISVIFGISIILTAALGFLGAGLPPPFPEWGSMIARGAPDAEVGRWWSATFPALALIFSVFAVSTAFSAWPSRSSNV